MITGTVNAHREAVLRLRVRDADGQEHERNAVVDTGFDGWLSLPPDFIAALGLRWHRFGRAILADGSESAFNIFKGVVLWDRYSLPMYLADGNPINVRVFDGLLRWTGQERPLPIQETDGDILLGMSFLYGARLLIDVLDGGSVDSSDIS